MGDQLVALVTKSLLHDIATPISSLDGALNLLLGHQLPQEAKHYLQDGLLAVAQLKRIYEHGSTALNGGHSSGRFNLNKLVDEVLQSLRGQISRNSVVVSTLEKSDINLLGSSILMERVLLNLLINALEELAFSEMPRLINIVIKKLPNKVFLSISDNGRGISPEDINQIFKFGFTTKKNGHQGLGLDFVKSIVHNYFEGSIEVKSKSQKGTTFTIKLPLSNVVQ